MRGYNSAAKWKWRKIKGIGSHRIGRMKAKYKALDKANSKNEGR